MFSFSSNKKIQKKEKKKINIKRRHCVLKWFKTEGLARSDTKASVVTNHREDKLLKCIEHMDHLH